MNWYDDLALTWHWVVMGSSLEEPKLDLIFAIFGFGLNVKG